jgi:hypothetical protein
MISRIGAAVLKQLQDKEEPTRDFLLGGGAPTLEAYREMVGYLRGLQEARQIVEETDEAMMAGGSYAVSRSA